VIWTLCFQSAAPFPFRPPHDLLCNLQRGLIHSDIYKQNDPHVDALDCGSLLVQ
jgi:hypothetical protein